MIKKIVKRALLKLLKKIILDLKSDINYSVISVDPDTKFPSKITNSICSFINIGEGCVISEVSSYGNVSLGRFVSITGPGTIVKSLFSSIAIGSFSSIGQNVVIVDFNHNIDSISTSFFRSNLFGDEFKTDLTGKGPVIIEEDVWIGSNSVILPGVKIGRGSVIGAGSVVTKSIPRYSIAFGNPAVIVSKRFSDDVILHIESLRWWEWKSNKILENKPIFYSRLQSKNN